MVVRVAAGRRLCRKEHTEAKFTMDGPTEGPACRWCESRFCDGDAAWSSVLVMSKDGLVTRVTAETTHDEDNGAMASIGGGYGGRKLELW